MTDLVAEALALGFSHAALLDAATLALRDEVIAMCAEDKCGAYGRNWACPPAVGTLDEHRATLAGYRHGVLVQTTAILEDPWDWDGMMAAGEVQKARLLALRDRLRPRYPGMLTLGNGACSVCETCAYPDAPCRHPDLAMVSMEAYGLVVSDVCTANGLGYFYGEGTITYTGCCLVE